MVVIVVAATEAPITVLIEVSSSAVSVSESFSISIATAISISVTTVRSTERGIIRSFRARSSNDVVTIDAGFRFRERSSSVCWKDVSIFIAIYVCTIPITSRIGVISTNSAVARVFITSGIRKCSCSYRLFLTSIATRVSIFASEIKLQLQKRNLMWEVYAYPTRLSFGSINERPNASTSESSRSLFAD